MVKYRENPKSRGSGIVCCIPQTGECPNKCEDCYFQSGRSFLEPLSKNLPNVPTTDYVRNRVVRVNDGNDSNVNRELVMKTVKDFPMKFYNTSMPIDLEEFDSPVVLTINPGRMTNKTFHKLKDPLPINLMFVRIRTNTWNIEMIKIAIEYYTKREIPVVLTFMAYFTRYIPYRYWKDYTWRKRTLNSYYAITTDAWERIMSLFKYNKWVYSCGKIEGEKGTSACHRCGNCLREYFYTIEKIHEIKRKMKITRTFFHHEDLEKP